MQAAGLNFPEFYAKFFVNNLAGINLDDMMNGMGGGGAGGNMGGGNDGGD